MDRADAAGFGVAAVGHVALFAALSLGFATTRLPVPKSDPIEVELVDEVGLESTSPTLSAEAPRAMSARRMPSPPSGTATSSTNTWPCASIEIETGRWS